MLQLINSKVKNLISKFRSPIVCSAFAALILFILKTNGFMQSLGITEESYQEFTSLLFAFLAAIGFLHNPNKYIKKEEE